MTIQPMTLNLPDALNPGIAASSASTPVEIIGGISSVVTNVQGQFAETLVQAGVPPVLLGFDEKNAAAPVVVVASHPAIAGVLTKPINIGAEAALGVEDKSLRPAERRSEVLHGVNPLLLAPLEAEAAIPEVKSQASVFTAISVPRPVAQSLAPSEADPRPARARPFAASERRPAGMTKETKIHVSHVAVPANDASVTPAALVKEAAPVPTAVTPSVAPQPVRPAAIADDAMAPVVVSGVAVVSARHISSFAAQVAPNESLGVQIKSEKGEVAPDRPTESSDVPGATGKSSFVSIDIAHGSVSPATPGSVTEPDVTVRAAASVQGTPQPEGPFVRVEAVSNAAAVERTAPLEGTALTLASASSRSVQGNSSDGNKAAGPQKATHGRIKENVSRVPSSAMSAPCAAVDPSHSEPRAEPAPSIQETSVMATMASHANLTPSQRPSTEPGAALSAPQHPDHSSAPIQSLPADRLEGAQPMVAHTTLQASPTVLEVGVPGGSHGWLKIRAEIGSGGNVEASLSAATHAGRETLHRELPEMTAFLTREQIAVQLHVANPPQLTALIAVADRDFAQASTSGEHAGGQQRERTPREAGDHASVQVVELDTDWSMSDYAPSASLHGGSWVNVVA